MYVCIMQQKAKHIFKPWLMTTAAASEDFKSQLTRASLLIPTNCRPGDRVSVSVQSLCSDFLCAL